MQPLNTDFATVLSERITDDCGANPKSSITWPPFVRIVLMKSKTTNSEGVFNLQGEQKGGKVCRLSLVTRPCRDATAFKQPSETSDLVYFSVVMRHIKYQH